jgi:hypothetical protein
MKIRRLCTSGRVPVAVPVVFAFGLLAWAGLIDDAPARKPDLAHVAMVRQKQMAWLEKHPLLLRISRSDIDGVPGDMLTNACWHLMKAVTPHPHPRATQPAQGGRI